MGAERCLSKTVEGAVRDVRGDCFPSPGTSLRFLPWASVTFGTDEVAWGMNVFSRVGCIISLFSFILLRSLEGRPVISLSV